METSVLSLRLPSRRRRPSRHRYPRRRRARRRTRCPARCVPSHFRRGSGRRSASKRRTPAAAVQRWDTALAACVGPSGEGDDAEARRARMRRGSSSWIRSRSRCTTSSSTCERCPHGSCHEALGAENDILRGFWHGAAPLDLVWLDEQQRPPSRFDLETAVDLVRPVPGRIRDAVTTVCAPEPVWPSRPRSRVR